MIEKRERRRRDGSTYIVWRVRWWDETHRQRSKSFDRAADARAFEAKIRTLKRTGALADVDAGSETLAEFVDEWWRVYAGPNLERATLRAYASFWNGHALPRIGQLQLRELTPQVIARFRADLEADGVGTEAIRKTMTMLQGVLQRAVEWGRIPSNAVKLTRKPPKPLRPAVQAIPPAVIETMRARLLEQSRLRDATLLSVLAYAGLRPQEALALEWRHVRDRTLLVERALSDGQLKALKTAGSHAPWSCSARCATTSPHGVGRMTPLLPPHLCFPPSRAASGAPPTGATGASATTGPWRRRRASTARARMT